MQLFIRTAMMHVERSQRHQVDPMFQADLAAQISDYLRAGGGVWQLGPAR